MTEPLDRNARFDRADALRAADDARMAHVRSILAKVLAGRSTLRSATLALGLPRDALPDDLGGRRLAVFRAYTGGVVRTVSPLAVRICAMEGVELDEVAMDLRPGMAGSSGSAACTPAMCGSGRRRER